MIHWAMTHEIRNIVRGRYADGKESAIYLNQEDSDECSSQQDGLAAQTLG